MFLKYISGSGAETAQSSVEAPSMTLQLPISLDIDVLQSPIPGAQSELMHTKEPRSPSSGPSNGESGQLKRIRTSASDSTSGYIAVTNTAANIPRSVILELPDYQKLRKRVEWLEKELQERNSILASEVKAQSTCDNHDCAETRDTLVNEIEALKNQAIQKDIWFKSLLLLSKP